MLIIGQQPAHPCVCNQISKSNKSSHTYQAFAQNNKPYDDFIAGL